MSLEKNKLDALRLLIGRMTLLLQRPDFAKLEMQDMASFAVQVIDLLFGSHVERDANAYARALLDEWEGPLTSPQRPPPLYRHQREELERILARAFAARDAPRPGSVQRDEGAPLSLLDEARLRTDLGALRTLADAARAWRDVPEGEDQDETLALMAAVDAYASASPKTDREQIAAWGDELSFLAGARAAAVNWWLFIQRGYDLGRRSASRPNGSNLYALTCESCGVLSPIVTDEDAADDAATDDGWFVEGHNDDPGTQCPACRSLGNGLTPRPGSRPTALLDENEALRAALRRVATEGLDGHSEEGCMWCLEASGLGVEHYTTAMMTNDKHISSCPVGAALGPTHCASASQRPPLLSLDEAIEREPDPQTAGWLRELRWHRSRQEERDGGSDRPGRVHPIGCDCVECGKYAVVALYRDLLETGGKYAAANRIRAFVEQLARRDHADGCLAFGAAETRLENCTCIVKPAVEALR